MMTAKEKRELYMKAYNEHKDKIDSRIADGIEKNRKGWCKVRLTDENGKPVAGKKSSSLKNPRFQIRCEYLYA